MHTIIAETSPIRIPAGLNVSRRAPRPTGDRQADYEERFDYKTLYYDVFQAEGRVVLSGPPLFNLLPLMQVAEISVNGAPHSGRRHLEDKWKTQRSFLEIAGKAERMALDVGKLKADLAVQPDHSEAFAGRRVLFTLSKDNDLLWIKDWAEFYVRCHGVDAVLIYDNASTAYSPQQLSEALAQVAGLKVAAVVPWPFKYGPGAGPSGTWDSDFCQYSVIEHARRRFLARCHGVINADIDELVVSDDDRSVFDYLDDSSMGAITYVGMWIEALASDAGGVPRHRDFRYFDKRQAPCTKKWTVRPSMIPDEVQMNVHSFGNGFTPPVIGSLKHRHFKGIHTGWKNARHQRVTHDPAVHELDVRWNQLIEKFGLGS